MRETKLLLSAWIFFLYLSSTSFAQTIQVTSNNNGQVQYRTNSASQTPTHLFILYGDGEFGMQNDPFHSFPPSPTGFTTEAYFVKAYDTNPPPQRTVNTGTTTTGPNNNPPTKINGEIDVLTSWATASGYEHFFIIAFKNENSQDTVDGCIEFHYRVNEISVNEPNIKEYNQWVINRQKLTSNKGNFDKKFRWNFKELAPQETRYIYVPAMVINKPGQQVNIATHYMVDCKYRNQSDHQIGESKSFNFRTHTHPHDPNSKTVNKPCLEPFLESGQRLEYTISFFNDGNGFAKDVYLFDALPHLLDPSTLQILDYEHKPQVVIKNHSLYIDFKGIMLPGTNQTIPKNYSYQDASSYVTFSICTVPNLPHPTTITNLAEIQFDNQAIFVTPPCTIGMFETCTQYDICEFYRQSDQEEIAKPSIYPEPRLRVQPNPFNNELTIKAYLGNSARAGFSLEIVDLAGKVVKQLHQSRAEFELFEQQFYLDDLPKGMYLVVLRTDRGIHTQKIVKL